MTLLIDWAPVYQQIGLVLTTVYTRFEQYMPKT